MPSRQDIAVALFGAWRLLRFDARGVEVFDSSIGGFWKSFFAAVLVAPCYLILLLLGPDESQAGFLRQVLVHLIAYSIGWSALPLLSHYICEALDRQSEYLRFVVALNWSKVLQIAIYLPPMLLAWFGIFGGSGDLLLFAASILILVYQWFVIKTALRLPGFGAVAFVILDLVIDVVILTVSRAMLA